MIKILTNHVEKRIIPCLKVGDLKDMVTFSLNPLYCHIFTAFKCLTAGVLWSPSQPCHVSSYSAIQIITSDRGVVEVGADVQYRVTSVEKMVMSVQDINHSIRVLVEASLKNQLVRKTVEELQKDKVFIAAIALVNIQQCAISIRTSSFFAIYFIQNFIFSKQRSVVIFASIIIK